MATAEMLPARVTRPAEWEFGPYSAGTGMTPREFDQYRQWGLARGFLEVVAGPLVRSSYRADRVFEKNNVGLNRE